MNCKSLHQEFKELRAKERSAGKFEGTPPSFSVDINSGRNTLRVKELAKELMSKCYDYTEMLSAGDRFDIKKIVSD